MARAEVAVIGGGAAGMLAAGMCAELGACVTLFEKNERFGRKLGITGKGRCNVCNDCTKEEFFDAVITNPKFLMSAYSAFPSSAVKDFFETQGVPLKTERGNRVFPVSDRAGDIVFSLVRYCDKNKVKKLHAEVRSVRSTESGFAVTSSLGEHVFGKVIIATGGVSYRSTGSTGDGYRFAESLGHTVTSPTPSLVPLVCREKYCADLMGLSLKNVTLTVKRGEKTVFSEMGEMLFTHFGVSGPLVLSASAHMRPMQPDAYRLYIDLKPALNEKELDNRLLSDFSENLNRNFANSLNRLLPAKLIPTAIKLSSIPPDQKVHSISKAQRKTLLDLLKAFPLTVRSFSDINEAIITCGGINVKEINPKTMESKLCPGLYFAGETIDCDAYTGGFNLQIAFSTAAAAARGAANNT